MAKFPQSCALGNNTVLKPHHWVYQTLIWWHLILILSVTPWTTYIAHQGPLAMEFSRQEYWSGLPCPSPGHLPDPGIEPGSSALWADALSSEPPGKPHYLIQQVFIICVALDEFLNPSKVVLFQRLGFEVAILFCYPWTCFGKPYLSPTHPYTIPPKTRDLMEVADC